MKHLLIGILLLGAQVLYAQPSGLQVGEKAPDFSATDQHGQLVQLQKMVEKGPVVVFFYRGQWCPYCNKQIKQMQDSLQLLSAKGASVLALSPDIQENIAKTVSKTKAEFPVLHDEGLRIMNAYKVTYAVDSATIDRYKKFNIDFNQVNGTNGAKLPVPAVYIIKNGVISYRYFNEDYTKRPSIRELVQQL